MVRVLVDVVIYHASNQSVGQSCGDEAQLNGLAALSFFVGGCAYRQLVDKTEVVYEFNKFVRFGIRSSRFATSPELMVEVDVSSRLDLATEWELPNYDLKARLWCSQHGLRVSKQQTDKWRQHVDSLERHLRQSNQVIADLKQQLHQSEQ